MAATENNATTLMWEKKELKEKCETTSLLPNQWTLIFGQADTVHFLNEICCTYQSDYLGKEFIHSVPYSATTY